MPNNEEKNTQSDEQNINDILETEITENDYQFTEKGFQPDDKE